MSYDPARKAYTFYAISSHGDNIFVRGQVQGKVWTWSDEVTMEGKKMKIVATVTEETPTSYSFKLEAGADGGQMMVVEQGKSTKVSKTT
jgi:microcompartment protein CcmK/EutM